MIYRDKLEQEIIKGILALDQKNAIVSISNLITDKFLKPGHYISLERANKECFYHVATYSNLEQDEFERYFEEINKELLLILVLIENLSAERYILIVGDLSSQTIGSAFDEKYNKFPRYKLIYPELEERLLALAGKEFIPTRKLIEYVENGFKTSEELALEKQLKHYDETIEKQNEAIKEQSRSTRIAMGALIISIISLVVSVIIPLISKGTIKKIEEPIVLKNEDAIRMNIVNDSLNVFVKNDTLQNIIINNSFPIKSPSESLKTALKKK